MALSVVLTGACGAHAWGQMRTSVDVPLAFRWMFFLYAFAFFFAAWANYVMMLVTLYSKHHQPGPYHVGTFTLLLLVTYWFSVSFRVRRRLV